MPWAAFSAWFEEDRDAVLTYRREWPPVRHDIPGPAPDHAPAVSGAVEQAYGPQDDGR